MQFVLKVSFLISSVFAQQQWSYYDQDQWSENYMSCNGSRMSPINIDTKNVKTNSSLKIIFKNYEKSFKNSTAENTGHTVRVYITPIEVSQTPYITGEAVQNQNFILDSLHFHWSTSDSNGSEHSINNLKRSGEMHLVHWNQKYGSLSNARDESDGLAVVTVFLRSEEAVEINLFFSDIKFDNINVALAPIIDALSRINQPDTNTRIRAALNLNSLLPSDRSLFYRYEGSLTTPPCSQTVTFLIFDEPIEISSDQLSQFRRLYAKPENGTVEEHLLTNTRKQQATQQSYSSSF